MCKFHDFTGLLRQISDLVFRQSTEQAAQEMANFKQKWQGPDGAMGAVIRGQVISVLRNLGHLLNQIAMIKRSNISLFVT